MKLKELFESNKKRRTVSDAVTYDYTGGDFWCMERQITSLDGSPAHVKGTFACRNNRLTNLEGGPTRVDRSYTCNSNKLTSLKGVASHIGGSFWCNSNKLTSLEGVHLLIEKMNGKFNAVRNPIESHVLGLLLIPGITEVMLDNKKVAKILNKHLGKGEAGMLQAQEELKEAGFEKFAQV